MILRIGIIALMVMSVGCGFGTSAPSTRTLTEIRGQMPEHKILERTLSRKEFQVALEDRALTRIRIVPVTRGEGDFSLPEYRLFSILPNSPYALLGLENADILVAADDYVLYDPNKFPLYVSLLATQPGGKIEFRRGGETYLIDIHFL